MSSPQVAVRMCPPEIDDSTFNHLMLTRDDSVCTNNFKPRCIEPEGEPESDAVLATNPSFRTSVMQVPLKRPSFLGTTNAPNLIRKVGMCMMMLSAVALNLTVVGALVKSRQAPRGAVVNSRTTKVTKPKRMVARPASSGAGSLPQLRPMNATSKAKPKAVAETAAAEEPKKLSEDHEEKVISDSAAHFIIPVPLPPSVPLPPTIQEPIPDPDSATPTPQENIGSLLSSRKQEPSASDAFEENQDGISVKMLLPETEQIQAKNEVQTETRQEKEERERKKLRALLIEAEEDFGSPGTAASKTSKIENVSSKKEGTGSGRLHTKDPNEIVHGSGGGMQAKWGAEAREKLASWGSEEAARKGPAKFMSMESTSHKTLDSYTLQIMKAKAKREEEEETETEDDSLLDEVKKALPKTVFGFR